MMTISAVSATNTMLVTQCAFCVLIYVSVVYTTACYRNKVSAHSYYRL